jgi:hypothetical protein
MPADLIVVIPTSLYKGSWLETIEDELLLRGIMTRIKEKAEKIGWHGRIDKDLIYDILTWKCLSGGESKCPAVVFEGESVYLLMLDEKEDRFIKVLNFEDAVLEEIGGIVRYSECIARYGYDYC